MLLDGIISLLVADAGVNALVGTNVYESVLPRGYTLPSICVHTYGETREYDYSGPVGVQETQVQFDVYGPDALTARTVAEAVKTLLSPYVGTLPDSTVVQACYLERSMAMPFLPHADQKGIANRVLVGYRFIYQVS